MRLSGPFIGGLSALLLLGAWRTGISQTAAPAAPAAAAKPQSVQPLYYPSMGDMMTLLVQPRHIKLGLAGKAQNWEYASYELNELRNTFGRIAHTIPVYRTMDTEQMVMRTIERPLNALDHAIIAADPAKFDAAYAALTEACNGCHTAEQHPMVVIKAPERAAFPDQDFRRKPR
jgi:hypothetical protein